MLHFRDYCCLCWIVNVFNLHFLRISSSETDVRSGIGGFVNGDSCACHFKSRSSGGFLILIELLCLPLVT